MIKLIIFDWDDVFTLGSKEGYIKGLHETLEDLDVHLKPEEEHKRILETWGKVHDEELKNLLRERPGLIGKAIKIYETKLFGGTYVRALSYVEGANEMLRDLSQDFLLAVATGAHHDILKNQVMPKFKVPDVFAQIVSVYELNDPSKNKPHPYMLEKIMNDQNCLPAETIFVGDAETDVLMARNAGVEPVVVLSGHLTRTQAEALGVSYIIPDVTHMREMARKF
jgi:phosphoglycolate phosphatase